MVSLAWGLLKLMPGLFPEGDIPWIQNLQKTTAEISIYGFGKAATWNITRELSGHPGLL